MASSGPTRTPLPGTRPCPPAGRLGAAGVATGTGHARPVVTVFSTGDEVVPPDTAALMPGQVRDATAVALAALITEAGGDPVPGGIVADDPGLLEAALRLALDGSDLIVVSAGSSVGARDETAAAVGRLGEPGIWCHGLAIKPGKPTLLAECGDVPVIGLPGNPRSALVVFRLIGMPLVRLVAGGTLPPAADSARARHRAPRQAPVPSRSLPADRDAAGAAGRRVHPAASRGHRAGPARPRPGVRPPAGRRGAGPGVGGVGGAGRGA